MVNPEYIKRILQGMTDVLKPAGFSKKGKVFVSEREDVILFVDLYNDMGRSLDELRVRIRIGAYSPALEDAMADRAIKKGWHECLALKGRRPSRVDDCHWSHHWPMGEYVFVSSLEDAERVAAEAACYLQEFALREFAKLTPASRLHDVLFEGRRWGRINLFGEEVLFEWATAQGKTAYRGDKPITTGDIGPVKSLALLKEYRLA